MLLALLTESRAPKTSSLGRPEHSHLVIFLSSPHVRYLTLPSIPGWKERCQADCAQNNLPKMLLALLTRECQTGIMEI